MTGRMKAITLEENDNDMTGSIYHNTRMSQRPIRGDCEYPFVGMPAPAQMFGNGKKEN
jgi:hypothetical protein